MDIIIRDQNGNMLPTVPGTYDRRIPDLSTVEASRVEGIDVKLSDDAESIILTVTLEEV